MRKARVLAIVTPIVALSLLLAGCGSSGAKASTDQSGGTAYNGDVPASSAVPLGASGAGTMAAYQVSGSGQVQGIQVTGEGRVSAAPDVAILSLGVSASAATVAEANTQATNAMNRLLDSLKANGVDEKDIQTTQFSIYPEYGPSRPSLEKDVPQIVGYRVVNMVTAKVRNIDQVGKIIDDAARAAGDLAQVHGISFTIDDPTDLRQQAREKAMEDARVKARQLADLAGVGLGRPIYISESGGFPPPIPLGFGGDVRAVESVPVPVSSGQLDVTVNVNIVYAIQ